MAGVLTNGQDSRREIIAVWGCRVIEHPDVIGGVGNGRHRKLPQPRVPTTAVGLDPVIQSVIETVVDAIIILDGDGSVASWSAPEQRLVGLSDREALERPFDPLFADTSALDCGPCSAES